MEEPRLTIEELLASYVLGKISLPALPSLAIEAIENKYESESMYIVAGMNSTDSYFELKEYFDRALDELQVNIRDKTLAAKLIVNYIVNEILERRSNCYGGVNIIINTNFHYSCPQNISKDEYYHKLGLLEIYEVWQQLNREIKEIDYAKVKTKAYHNFIAKKDEELYQLVKRWSHERLKQDVDRILFDLKTSRIKN